MSDHRRRLFRISVEELESRWAPALFATIDYSRDTNNFFNTQAKRDLLQLAANTVVSQFGDSLDAITPGGGNTWSAVFSDPATGNNMTVPNLTILNDEIRIYAGGRNLGAGVLGLGGFGGFSASGSSSFLNTVRARGETGALAPTPTDFGLWGGSVVFGTTANWFFGETTAGLGNNQNDFLTVAVHELTHLMGFGTADSWDALVNPATNRFAGAAATAAFDTGGNPFLHSDQGHWAEGTTDGGVETIMDPSIIVGTRKVLTGLDLAAMDDIGWELIGPPTVTLGIDFATIPERGGAAVITANLNRATASNVTVNLTFNGTATINTDYTLNTGLTQIVIAAGQTTGTLSILSRNDMIDEANETVNISIANVVNGVAGGGSVSTTIVDDDESIVNSAIIDNGDAEFSTTGTWTPSAGQGRDNDVHFAASGNGSAVASWSFVNLAPGAFRVSATWTEFSNRATDAPFRFRETINGPTLSTVTINQQLAPNDLTDSGSNFENLGIVTITGNTLVVQLTNAGNNFLIADAIRIERVHPIIVIDDGDAGFAASSAFTPTSGQGRDNDVRFAAAGTGTNSATWTFNNLSVGDYRVSATWSPFGNRATNARYFIREQATGPSLATATINQQNAANDFTDGGSAWENLGTVSIVNGTLVVQLDDNANGFVIADAIRIERVSTPIIDDGDLDMTTTSGFAAVTGQGFGSDVRFAAAGDGSQVARWVFNGLTSGFYSVAATWTSHPNRASVAPYFIRESIGGNSIGTANLNQQVEPNDFVDAGVTWERISNFFISGSTLVVELSNNANGFVIADAIRIERRIDPDQVIDDGSPLFFSSNGFQLATGQGFGSDVHFAAAGAGAETASWTFSGLAGGQYRVSTTWTAFNNRATNAHFRIQDPLANGGADLLNVAVNQQIAPNDFTDAGIAWEELGTVTAGAELVIQLTNNANGFVIADAIRVERVGDLTKDNGDLGFSTSGSFSTLAGQGRGNDVAFAAAGNGSSTADWSFTGLSAGQYTISATWSPFANRATNANFRAGENVGALTLLNTNVNQQLAPNDFAAAGSDWEVLGTVTITGSTLVVRLNNNANGFVIADAIRLTPGATGAGLDGQPLGDTRSALQRWRDQEENSSPLDPRGVDELLSIDQLADLFASR